MTRAHAQGRPKPLVVGIGASAGGLAALTTFFRQVPEGAEIAFVVVVHLSPDHESLLADLLQPHVRQPVLQVTQTVPLEGGHVYVIPPNANLNAVDTHLRLSALETARNDRAPIDHFFHTLASTYDGRSVAVLLTGTGSDGALGLREVKERGGRTIVQAPEQAEYDEMPRNAIATGRVDRVLRVEEIPAEILRFARSEPSASLPDDDQLLRQVFEAVRAGTGRDFSRYKRSTVGRRTRRRMQLRGVESLADYLELLRGDPAEAGLLADDLLITVTRFFRDPEAFDKLEGVLPTLFDGRGPHDSVRVWSVGCATGEEAYSLAILLLEGCERRGGPRPHVQVFASDLHAGALESAREGLYTPDAVAGVSEARRERFFQRVGEGWRVRREVRDLVVFAPHDLLADPPFSRVDLVVCRNVMIYLQRPVQEEVAALFHYALRPGGYLLIGSSETVGSADLFRTESEAHGLYRRRDVPTPQTRLPVYAPTRGRPAVAPAQTDGGGAPAPTARSTSGSWSSSGCRACW